MTVEIENFWSVGFEIAFVALNGQCSLWVLDKLKKTYLWTLCYISGKNLALQIFWWFYSLSMENLYFSGKGAHSVILRNHRSIKKKPKKTPNQLFIIHELSDVFIILF